MIVAVIIVAVIIVAEIMTVAASIAEATTEIAGNRNRSFSIPEKSLFAELTRQRQDVLGSLLLRFAHGGLVGGHFSPG